MGKRKDIESAREDATPSAAAEAPANAIAAPAATEIATPTVEASQHAAPTDIPSMAPSASTHADAAGPAANEAVSSRRPSIGASSQLRAQRFALLAASIAFAAAFGAFAGSLGAAGLAQLFPASSDAAAITRAAAAQTHRTLQALAADLTALKSNLDVGSKSAQVQFNKIAERLERAERAQAEPDAKLARMTEQLDRLERRAAAPETTGSIADARPAADGRLPPRPPALDKPHIDGWVLHDINGGRAIVGNRSGGLYEIGPGANLPGIGRVETIRRQDGRWVVVTSRGIITSYR